MTRKQPVNIILTLVLMAATLLLSIPRTAYACSCAGPATPAEGLAHSDAVFAGRVTAIDRPFLNRLTGGAEIRQVTFAVSKVWKGDVNQKISLTTAPSGEACGYEFSPGHEYLVYAGGSRDGLSTGLCTRTRPLSSAAGDLSVLGTGAAPGPAGVLGAGAGSLASFIVSSALLVSVSVIVVLVLLFVRRQVRTERP